MGRQHGVLQGIGGIVRAVACHLGKPVELPMVAVEQLLEGVPIPCYMCGEQLCVGSVTAMQAPHSRTLNGAGGTA
jgi:hypothetical protein